MTLDTAAKLSRNTLVLHWLVGILMIGLLATGVYMVETEAYGVYPWHKSIGVIIFLFVIARVAWRIKNRWPVPAGDYSAMEKTLSKIVHWLLIGGTVLLPVSGFLMSALGGYGVAVFGLELVAMNPDPADANKMIPLNGPLAGLAHSVHEFAGYAVIAGVVLHIVGAFKHHLIDRDGTLRRMLGAEI